MPVNRKPGRPKATDKPDVVSLLVSAFRDGMTVRQACIQSGISHEAYYRRCREDTDFADKMYFAQQTIMTAARKNVIKAIKSGDLRVRFQNMIFPEGVILNTKTMEFGTVKISPLYRYAPNKKDLSVSEKSLVVTREGVALPAGE